MKMRLNDLLIAVQKISGLPVFSGEGSILAIPPCSFSHLRT